MCVCVSTVIVIAISKALYEPASKSRHYLLSSSCPALILGLEQYMSRTFGGWSSAASVKKEAHDMSKAIYSGFRNL